MIHGEKYLQSGTNKIYAQSWEIDHPKGFVGIIHGMGEHSGRYTHMASFLNEHGYSAFAMDHIGHGKSDGKRGHVKNYDLLLYTVQVFLDDINNRNQQKLPVFLFAHSMGGNVLTMFLIQRKPAIQGAILSAPWYRLAFDPPALQLFLAKLMMNIYPAFSNESKLDVSTISKDPIEVQKYLDDPLISSSITPAFFLPAFKNGLWAIQHAQEIKIPVLLYHGTADRLISPEGSKEFKKNGGDNIELKLWEGVYHEGHNDLEKLEIMGYMTNWIDHHLL